MLRNCLAAALRHLGRNRLYVAISVGGLAIGLWGALIAGLTIRSQYTREHFIAGYDHVYQVIGLIDLPGFRLYQPSSHNRIAGLLRARFPQLQSVARTVGQALILHHGAVEAKEIVYWADPDVFQILRLPVVAGDLDSALRRPDGIVLSRSLAHKYFGRDDPVGQTLLLQDAPQPMGELSSLGGPRQVIVGAVIEDFPANDTSMEGSIFASGLSRYSELTRLDGDAANQPGGKMFNATVTTLLRLAPGASIEPIRRALPDIDMALSSSQWGSPPAKGKPFQTSELIRIDRRNTHPGINPDFQGRLIMSVVLGSVVLLIACLNFVNLLTARSTRRGLEVGIRKVAGAGRHLLVWQFLGESTLYVFVAMLIAVALTEWSLPSVNAFLTTAAGFDYWRNPAMLGGLLAGTLGLGIVAGAYPALVLSGFRPLAVLNGTLSGSRRGGWIRASLVTLQFAILIGLVVCAGVIYQQRMFATNEALRADTDQVLGIWSTCRDPFVAELRALPGVRSVACSGLQLMFMGNTTNVTAHDGHSVTLSYVPAELSIFDVYGLKPIAGRLAGGAADSGQYVINESAVRRLKFASAEAAVGQKLIIPDNGPPDIKPLGSQIIGVIPDFSLASVDHKIEPTAYLVAPKQFNLINLKLAGGELPQTLADIDRIWKRTGGTGPINRFFMIEQIQQQYLSMLREAQGFGIFTVLAALLASLGLLGLSACITERRTREIGVRKALGADTAAVVRLLLWQFSKPVLVANLIAWPVAAWAMQRWLRGFAYHVDLAVWLFPAAAGLALLVALMTVTVHSVRVARAKPIVALRYE
jgi:putative ABC transport system permease protein